MPRFTAVCVTGMLLPFKQWFKNDQWQSCRIEIVYGFLKKVNVNIKKKPFLFLLDMLL